MAKAKSKRRRFYACSTGWFSKRDALAEAALIRKIGHKVVVKPDGAGYKVCRTYKRSR